LEDLKGIVKVEVKKCDSNQVEDQAEPEHHDQTDELSLFWNVAVESLGQDAGQKCDERQNLVMVNKTFFVGVWSWSAESFYFILSFEAGLY
jgi:hypothetical protein